MKKFSEWLVERSDDSALADLGISRSGMQVKRPEDVLSRKSNHVDKNRMANDLEQALHKYAGVPLKIAHDAAHQLAQYGYIDRDAVIKAADDPMIAIRAINGYFDELGRSANQANNRIDLKQRFDRLRGDRSSIAKYTPQDVDDQDDAWNNKSMYDDDDEQ